MPIEPRTVIVPGHEPVKPAAAAPAAVVKPAAAAAAPAAAKPGEPVKPAAAAAAPAAPAAEAPRMVPHWKVKLEEGKKIARQRKDAADAKTAADKLASDTAAEKTRLEEARKGGPRKFLEAGGYTAEQLLEEAVQGGKPLSPELLAFKKEIDALKAEREEERKAKETASKDAELNGLKQRETEAETKFMKSVEDAISAQPEKYALVVALGQHKDVAELVKKHWQETGKIASHDEIAADLEKEIETNLPKQLAEKGKAPKFLAAMKAAIALIEPAPAKPAEKKPRRELDVTVTNEWKGATTPVDEAPATSLSENWKKIKAARRGQAA